MIQNSQVGNLKHVQISQNAVQRPFAVQDQGPVTGQWECGCKSRVSVCLSLIYQNKQHLTTAFNCIHFNLINIYSTTNSLTTH